jgi:acetyl esterase/lipase
MKKIMNLKKYFGEVKLEDLRPHSKRSALRLKLLSLWVGIKAQRPRRVSAKKKLIKTTESLLLTLLFSCASHPGYQDFDILRNIHYTENKIERQEADVYIPEGKGPFPGVILVHGGGWKSRDRTDMDSIAKSLASNGFSVLNINYRFAPEYLHPAPINDLERALIFFKKNNTKFKLDPHRVGLWGYSSGGHTVSYFALTKASDAELRVEAVVSGGAPYDLTWYPESPYIKGYMGEFRDKLLKEYFDASVTSWVTEEAPPFFLYHAENDDLVEYAQATALEARLKLKKVPVSVHKIKFWGHATAFAISDLPVKRGIKFLKRNL